MMGKIFRSNGTTLSLVEHKFEPFESNNEYDILWMAPVSVAKNNLTSDLQIWMMILLSLDSSNWAESTWPSTYQGHLRGRRAGRGCRPWGRGCGTSSWTTVAASSSPRSCGPTSAGKSCPPAQRWSSTRTRSWPWPQMALNQALYWSIWCVLSF